MFVWQRQDEGLWSDVEDCETFEWRMAEGAKAVRDPKPLASARDQQPKHAAARTGAGDVHVLACFPDRLPLRAAARRRGVRASGTAGGYRGRRSKVTNGTGGGVTTQLTSWVRLGLG